MKSVMELEGTINGLENRLKRLMREKPTSGEVDVVNKEIQYYKRALHNIQMLQNDIRRLKTDREFVELIVPYAGIHEEMTKSQVKTEIANREAAIATILENV